MIARYLPRAARAAITIALACLAAGSGGCAQSTAARPGGARTTPARAASGADEGAQNLQQLEQRRQRSEEGMPEHAPATDRLLVQRASLGLEAENLVGLRDRTAAAATALGGYVETVTLEQQGYPNRPSLRMSLRVPARSLDAMLDTLRGAGRVRDETRQALDVTEEVVDADARLRNLIGVRDRLREHLTRSGNVADVVAVERELARVQGQIDALEARLKHLRGTVALAQIDLTAAPRVVLGPLGVVAKGLGWVVAKLFVIR